jgi:hypothetical protein
VSVIAWKCPPSKRQQLSRKSGCTLEEVLPKFLGSHPPFGPVPGIDPGGAGLTPFQPDDRRGFAEVFSSSIHLSELEGGPLVLLCLRPTWRDIFDRARGPSVVIRSSN